MAGKVLQSGTGMGFLLKSSKMHVRPAIHEGSDLNENLHLRLRGKCSLVKFCVSIIDPQPMRSNIAGPLCAVASRNSKYIMPMLGSLGSECLSKTLYRSVAECGNILRVTWYLPCASDRPPVSRSKGQSVQSPRMSYTRSCIDLCLDCVTRKGVTWSNLVLAFSYTWVSSAEHLHSYPFGRSEI